MKAINNHNYLIFHGKNLKKKKLIFKYFPKNLILTVFVGMTKRQKSSLKFFTETEKIKH